MADADPFARIAQQSAPIQRGVSYNPNPEFQGALADWTNNAMAYGFRPDPFSPQNDIGNSELRFAQTMKNIMDQQMAANNTTNIASLPGYLYNFLAGMQPLMSGPNANVVLGNSGQFANGYQPGPLQNTTAMSPMVQAYLAAINRGGGNTNSPPALGAAPTSTPGNIPSSQTPGRTFSAPQGSDTLTNPLGTGNGAPPSNIAEALARAGTPQNTPAQTPPTQSTLPNTNPAITGSNTVPADNSATVAPAAVPQGFQNIKTAQQQQILQSIMRAVLGSLMQVAAPEIAGQMGMGPRINFSGGR